MMDGLYRRYPEDVDAGAFYALSLRSSEKPGDSSLAQERKGDGVVAAALFKGPGQSWRGAPAMAADGLAAADHYGEIAQSGSPAFHMPGHIYARLGLWQKDIASQIGSIEAAEATEKLRKRGVMDEPHSYDFLVYAYDDASRRNLPTAEFQSVMREEEQRPIRVA